MVYSFKPGYIYLFKLKGQTGLFEGEFFQSVHAHLIWRGLPFSCSNCAPRFTRSADIEWAEEVMLMEPDTTEVKYMAALKTLPP